MSKSVWPLVVVSSFLVFATSKTHQNGKPVHQENADEEQVPNPQPIPLVTADATVMNSPATRESLSLASPWWKGPLEAGALLVALGLLILNLYQSRATQQAANAAIEPSQPGIYSRIKNGGEVPRESLVLTYDPIGGIAANQGIFGCHAGRTSPRKG